MLRLLIAGGLAIAGLIHLLPLPGVLGAERLTALYGVALADPDLILLLRHRAVLFGLLGAFLLFAAMVPRFQVAATALGLASALSFLALAWLGEPYNAAIARVVIADLVAVAALVLAALALWRQGRRAGHGSARG
jgi:hypothetical protein